MNKHWMIVLDFITAEIHIYPYDIERDDEMFLEEKGHSISDCYYMTVNNLNLQIHE